MSARAAADELELAILDQLDQHPVSLLSMKVQQIFDIARCDGSPLPLGQLHHKLRISDLVDVGLSDVAGLPARLRV